MAPRLSHGSARAVVVVEGGRTKCAEGLEEQQQQWGWQHGQTPLQRPPHTLGTRRPGSPRHHVVRQE
eukprot:13780550-Alexandrium_andersonii.AAC.1